MPIGYLLAGPLASTIGVRTTLLLAASWAAASCAAVLTSRSVRGLTARPADPPSRVLKNPRRGMSFPDR